MRFIAPASERKIELGYAENLTGGSVSGVAGYYEDVGSLVLTFEVKDRPVIVMAGGATLFANVAGARPRMMLTDEANTVLNYVQHTAVSASEHHPTGVLFYRFPANSGTKTVKVRAGAFSGTGTIQTTFLTTGGGVIWLQATEV